MDRLQPVGPDPEFDARSALAALIEEATDAVALLRPDGSVLSCNEPFRGLRDGASPIDRSVLKRLVEGPGAREPVTVHVHGKRLDGTLRPLVDAEGAVRHVLVVLREAAIPLERLGGLPERGSVLGQQIDSILELVPAAVYIGDMSGLRYVNREGLRQLGFGGLDDVHADIGSLAKRIDTRHVYTREPISTEEQVFVQALNGAVAASDVLVTHLLTGEERIVHCVAAPLRLEGVIIGAIAINSDVTEQRRHAAAQHELDRVRALDRLASGLAHDFNNLSMAALGFLHLALRLTPEEDARRPLLTQVQQAIDRAAAIGADLLSLTRRRVLRLERVDLREWVAREQRTATQRCSWRVRMPHAGDVFVRADPERMDQVLGVLLANAAHVTPPDGPVIVTVEALESVVRVSVSDRGPSLGAAQAQRVFEPYEIIRGQPTSLALASLRGLVEQMKGSVGVTAEDVGTTFWFELPREVAPSPEPAVEAEPARGGAILLVEDDASVRQVLCKLLRGDGYTVVEASDGVEALGHLRVRRDVRLVISDVLMPGMDGRDLFAVVAREYPGLPVILMTGDPGIDPAAEAGPKPVALFQKPFPPEELLARVRQHVAPTVR